MRGARKVTLAACALAGCGRLDFDPRDGGAELPVIDATPGPDADPSADTDGDTILDPADNCQLIPNPDQADEDSDALGDVCDPCPISADNTDGDTDGVGDDCDPRPGISGETIVFFDGLGAYDPAEWEFFGEGTWTQVPGGLHYDSLSLIPGALLVPLDFAPPVHVVGEFELLALEQNNTTMSLIDGVDVAAEDGEKCGAGALQSANPTLATGDFVANSSIAETQAAWPGSTALGTVYTLRLDHRDAVLDCVGRDDSPAGTTIAQPAQRGAGRVGVRLRGLDADVRYLLVVASDS